MMFDNDDAVGRRPFFRVEQGLEVMARGQDRIGYDVDLLQKGNWWEIPWR